MPRRKKPEPSLVAILGPIALVAFGLFIIYSGWFKTIGKPLVDHATESMQDVTEKRAD
jgi:hypothetical protein